MCPRLVTLRGLQVTFAEAVSPRQHSPATPTPHHSHGFLQRGFSGGSDLNSTVNSQQEDGPYMQPPDRSVSFKVACGRNVCHHPMHSLDSLWCIKHSSTVSCLLATVVRMHVVCSPPLVQITPEDSRSTVLVKRAYLSAL